MRHAAGIERTGAIGLEVDTREIRAAQLSRGGGGWSIRASAVVPRDTGDEAEPNGLPSREELARLRDVLERRGFVGNQISVGAPSRVCAFHILDLPPSGSGAPIDELAKAEISRGNDEDRAIEVATWGHHQPYRERVRFAVAADSGVIVDLAERSERSGFDLLRVVPRELALFRTLAHFEHEDDDEINALVSIGWDETHLTLATGRTPVYSRSVPLGLSSVGGRAAECVNMGATSNLTEGERLPFVTLAASVARHLDTSLSYVSQTYRTAPFGGIWCSGYLADEREVVDTLSDRVGLPTHLVDVAQRCGERGGAVEFYERRLEPRLNTACGLAMGDAA